MSKSAPAQAARAERATTRDQGRVLLVTEEPDPVFSAALVRAGFAVVGVAGGAAAMVSLRRTRPHVIIIDTRLKGISAVELARMITQAQDSVPFIMAGADEATAERRRVAMQEGASDYFQLPADVPLLVARTAQLVAIKQTMNRLRAEADRDYLTGLANRRRFRTALGQELERWRRYRVPCALIIADVDYLKKINDTHGHSAGDMAIRHIASALSDLSRDNDTAARLGGEEFALLLAGANDTSAVAAAERLRCAVAATPVDTIGTVTISLGVAACPAHAATERALYAAADAALYEAKRNGRNRIAVAPAPQQG